MDYCIFIPSPLIPVQIGSQNYVDLGARAYAELQEWLEEMEVSNCEFCKDPVLTVWTHKIKGSCRASTVWMTAAIVWSINNVCSDWVDCTIPAVHAANSPGTPQKKRRSPVVHWPFRVSEEQRFLPIVVGGPQRLQHQRRDGSVQKRVKKKTRIFPVYRLALSWWNSTANRAKNNDSFSLPWSRTFVLSSCWVNKTQNQMPKRKFIMSKTWIIQTTIGKHTLILKYHL